jgi:hypothetical protein
MCSIQGGVLVTGSQEQLLGHDYTGPYNSSRPQQCIKFVLRRAWMVVERVCMLDSVEAVGTEVQISQRRHMQQDCSNHTLSSPNRFFSRGCYMSIFFRARYVVELCKLGERGSSPIFQLEVDKFRKGSTLRVRCGCAVCSGCAQTTMFRNHSKKNKMQVKQTEQLGTQSRR